MNLNVSSFSSSQGRLNFSFGIEHRLRAFYGNGQIKPFWRITNTWTNTPKIGDANGPRENRTDSGYIWRTPVNLR